MASYKELESKVLFRFPKGGGRARLAVRDAINDALKYIARAKDFDDLMVLDTTNAITVVGTATYHLINDWNLTRPKDIYSLRYMDEQKSRKLEYIPPRLLDEVFPYVLSLGTQKPTHYTRRGNEVELVAVPDEAKPVYVFYSQWPEELIKDNDEPPFQNLDDVIIQLAEDIARGALEGSRSNYVLRAKELLGTALREDITRPDRTLVARPFQAGELMIGEYWKNPFIKSDP